MTEKKLYALTDDIAHLLRDWVKYNRSLHHETASRMKDALTPATVDDLGDDAIERMARGLSEHWRDMHTNEALGQQRMLARAALAALLQEDE